MYFLRICTLAIALSMLNACSTNLELVAPDEPTPGLFSVSSTNFLYVASAVQWNQDYAVSAAHTPRLANVKYRCSTGCDLVFIRRSADGVIPNWRASVVGEPVKTAGINMLMLTVKGIGTNSGTRVRLNHKNDRGVYALCDAPVEAGMSGGAVYGSDNAVVGMTIGIFLPFSASQHDQKTMSTYVPYEVIEHEWKLFSQDLAAQERLLPTGPQARTLLANSSGTRAGPPKSVDR
nr:hypothetical protein FFPRI1PSEUD_24280 [Pseudomonas sp. FFPRI_1]